MSLIGYARVRTNPDGKIFDVDSLKGITARDDMIIQEYIDAIMLCTDIFNNPDSDLLITIKLDVVEPSCPMKEEYFDIYDESI